MSAELHSQTLAELAYHQLRTDILEGRHAPNSKLRIDALRELYGMGATPLREALSKLSAQGLVNAEGQRGFSVAQTSIQQLLDVTRSRVWVESIALRAAIANGNRDWEAEIVAAEYRLRALFLPAAGDGAYPSR